MVTNYCPACGSSAYGRKRCRGLLPYCPDCGALRPGSRATSPVADSLLVLLGPTILTILVAFVVVMFG